MYYKEFCPHPVLKNFVQCYFVCENDKTGFAGDKVYATGFMELLFNTSTDTPQQIQFGGITTQPCVQLWGQTIEPFSFFSSGKHSMFGIRFFPHTAACFLNERVDKFNNQVVDFADIGGKAANTLHAKLVEAKLIERKIELVNEFLLKTLDFSANKIKLVNSIIHDLPCEAFFENINTIASRYGISSRYLQKIFLHYTGISPKLFIKIARFQKSMRLVACKGPALTSIAHECGYFDQSHFIKDFKFFTGLSPSRFFPESSTDFLAVFEN